MSCRLLLALALLAACHAPTDPGPPEIGSIVANGCTLRTDAAVYSYAACPAPPYATTWTGSLNGGPVLTFTVTWDYGL